MINSQADFELNAFEYNLWEEGEDGNWYETDKTTVSLWSNGVSIQIDGVSIEELTENNFIFE